MHVLRLIDDSNFPAEHNWPRPRLSGKNLKSTFLTLVEWPAFLVHDRDDEDSFVFDAKYYCIRKAVEQTAPCIPVDDRPCCGIVTDALEGIAKLK